MALSADCISHAADQGSNLVCGKVGQSTKLWLVQLRLEIHTPWLVGLTPYSQYSASVRSGLGLQKRRKAPQAIPKMGETCPCILLYWSLIHRSLQTEIRYATAELAGRVAVLDRSFPCCASLTSESCPCSLKHPLSEPPTSPLPLVKCWRNMQEVLVAHGNGYLGSLILTKMVASRRNLTLMVVKWSY